MQKHIAVIDLGTQSVRAAIVAAGGEIRGIAQLSQEVDSPEPGWAQQRAASWWDMACRAMKQVLHDTAADPASIAAVACCGHMHGPTGIDDNGDITTEWTQIWCDKRCQPQCHAFSAIHGEDAALSLTGNRPHSGWVAFKILWIKENHPDIYDRTRCFLVPKDFLNYRLTGVAATDPSEASGTFLWDAAADAYSPDQARRVGVDMEKFAPVHAAHDVIGRVTSQAAQQTGLPGGTPVVAGGADFIVSMLGLGATQQGTAVDITGTSTLFAAVRDKPLAAEGFSNLRHVVPGWLPFTMLDCGGLSMKWCRDMFRSACGRDMEYEDIISLAQQAPPGAHGLTFYPYMLGERRSDNTAARGAFMGLTLNHSAAHMARAIMEGAACAVGRSVQMFREQGMDIRRVRCAGGGTRNELWNQIKADIYGVPLQLCGEPEAGIKGAALLGEAGASLIPDPAAEAVRRAAPEKIIRPDPANTDAYAAALLCFNHVYEHMLGFNPDSI